MPEKTVHGYNYKVRIWYPEAPENKTEGTILAAYEEDLAKEIQTRYPGVTYEIISKEPVLGDPRDLVILERKKEKIGELYGIPIYKIDITETLTLKVEAPLEQIGIVIPAWFIDTYTTQELSVRGRKYLVGISNIEGRTVIDIGEYVGPGEVEDVYQRVFTYNLIKPGTAEIWIPFDAEMAKEAINKALLIDAEIRSKSQGNPGPDELQFKAPLARADQFMNELRRYGYDVGHDADYEDPNNYMTVIVRNVPPGRKRLLFDTAERWTVFLKEIQNLRDRLIAEIYNNRMDAWKRGHVGVRSVSAEDLTEMRSMSTSELEQTAKLTRQFSYPLKGQIQEQVEYRWEFLPVGQGHYFHADSYERAFYKAIEEATRDVVIFQQWKPREQWKYAILPLHMKGWTPEQVIGHYVGQGKDRKMITEAMEGASIFHQGS